MMRRMKRAISMLLTLTLLISVLPMQSLAYYAGDDERPTVLVDSSGNQISVGEDWETTFPYGTFAFAVSEASVEEGGEAAVIRVYRLGGTEGRATAYLSYIPAAAEISAGVKSYANAAGANDIVIEVEDTLPIAKYQPIGRDPDPERTDARLTAAPYTGDDAEENDHVLSLDVAAETYQWYICDGSSWDAVSGADDATFVVSDEDYQQYDFRCVYTADGVSWCTDSVKGEAYIKPAAEKLPAQPDDIDLNPAQTFTELEMDPDDPYLGYVFSMTFAENEWVKEIRVTAPDDDEAEAIKGGYFTIVDCEGGSLYDTANTLALGVYDDEEPEPSTLGFTVTEIEADKSKGTAVLTVRRTGGTQNVLTLSWKTEDGTAVAGRDYTAASGSVAFYGDVTEQTIEIPLINDGVETEERRTFRVILSDLLGDSDGICTLEDTEATVSLYNTNTGDGENLATMLYDGEAVDASGDVDEAGSTVAPVDVDTVTGTRNEDGEDLVGVISGYDGGSELSPMTYSYGTISFSRGDKYDNWKDWAYVANVKSYSGDISTVGGFTNATWDGDGEKYMSSSWKLEDDHGVTAALDIANMAQKFKSYKGEYGFDVGILDTDIYGAEFTYPWASVVKGSGNTYTDYAYVDAEVDWDWGFFSGYSYEWYTSGTLTASWEITETELRGLRIGLSRHDSHDSDDDAYCVLWKGALERRVFDKSLQLRIHTANDGESGSGNIVTAPAGAAALTASSSVYTAMKPTVRIKSGQGGVNTSGKLYVGSTIQVQLTNTDSYDPYTGDKLTAAVYVTRSNGDVVNANVDKEGDTYNIELVWSGMTASDLTDTYTINVVMTREQDFKLDLSPSVERNTDTEGNPLAEIKTTQEAIDAAWDLFWNSAANGSSNYITIGYSDATATAPHFTRNVTTKTISKDSAGWTPESGKSYVRQLLNEQNVQYINFNRSAEDRILYNGRIYAGNETIWLDVADLALANATFRYYNEAYLSATSIMTADISSVGLYLDVDCNGQIDGYYDEGTGYFMLDDDTADQFIMFLENDVDYDESLFAPVAVKKDGEITYAQYFAKVFYTMTPRALTPESGHEDDRAQVLPAFVTNVTDPGEYAQLTGELRSYRYIISGMNRTKSKDKATVGDYSRSSDGHLMYGSNASKPQVIDVPLGGDISPAQAQEDGTFKWEPDYQGNLLCPFDNPEPIYIEHSLAGDDIPIADDFTIAADGTVTLNSDSRDRLNGYLGSFVGNSTITLCIQEQEKTTDEIAAAYGVSSGGSDLALKSTGNTALDLLFPESSTLAERGTFPNSDYLKAMTGGGSPDTPTADMSESDSDFEEFEVDLGVELPSVEIGVTDYVSIIMDGYEVGFSIGIPLGGYNSNGDAGAGGVGAEGGESGGSNWVSPKAANAANAEDMGKLRDFLRSPSRDSIMDTDDSLSNAVNDGNMSSSGFEVGFSVSMAFLFKYNSVDNDYYFSQFSIAVSAEMEYTYQYRLTPCPIVYLYVKVGFGIELGTGATVERETVELDQPLIEEEGATADKQPKTLKKGETYSFKATYKSFNITFDGKVALELLDKKDGNVVQWSTRGYLTSDGDDPITATMVATSDMKVNENYYIRITALEDTEITRLARVKAVETKSYWSGFSLSPEGFVEAGAGIGVEIMKFEVFIKISLGCGMTFGAWNDDKNNGEGGYDPFSFDEFSFSLGLGFRVVLLVFSYEMDLVGYSIEYDGEDDKWTHSWTALGGLFGGEIGELSATDADGNTYGVTIRLPGDTSETQSVYSGGNQDELSAQAYKASDAKVPFQLSGYASSGDAFKLADGLITGYDYQVVTVGTDNYLVYTIGRGEVEHEVDSTMLVLSRLRLTTVDGKDSYGLVNPLDENNATPYIILDDDGTGDLDFTAWVDGTTIHAAWVSYATKGEPVQKKEMPESAKPLNGTVEMAKDNYTNDAFKPAVVEDPGTKPAEPKEADYFITQGTYNNLVDYELKNGYTQASDDTSYYVTGSYETYAAASAAYGTAKQAYEAYDNLKSEYDAYVAAKAAYDAWYGYFQSLVDHEASVQEIAANAAKNTVVRKASYDTKGNTGFTAAKTVSGATGSFVYLPEGEGDGTVTVYAKAQHMTTGAGSEKEKAVNDYTAYLKTIGYDPTADNNDEAKRTIGSYRLTYQSGLWDAYGKGSSICVAADGVDSVAQLNLAEGQILDNFEVTKIGTGNSACYYLAYTTSETQYVNDAGTKTEAVSAVDRVTIKRLFLRTFTVSGTEIVWTNHGGDGDENKGVLLRTAYDYDIGSNTRSDGMYKGGSLDSSCQDPYFANLQFLRGNLGTSLSGKEETFSLMGGTQEDFLLFEMNGCTYIIRSADLQTIVSSEHKGSIIPFFAYEDVSGAEKSQSTGRAEVTIGADGAGNISAVYVAPVANTTNNAIYLSKYDPQTNTWGAGIMLAMNHMDVYEDSTENDWSVEDTGNAYLGKLAGYTNGGMDQFVFSNLAIALGQSATNSSSNNNTELVSQSERASASSMSRNETLALLGKEGLAANIPADGEVDMEGQLSSAQLNLLGETVAASKKDTLLVITQGTMTYLKESEGLILPMSDSDAQNTYQTGGYWSNRAPGVGIYAVSYGVGGQAIGEAKLTFADYDFSFGAELYAGLSFVNTGDVGIRGSAEQPITVSLVATETGGAPMTLTSWSIKENVIPGQKVQLSGDFTLPKTLPAGTKLTLSVTESDYYKNNGGGIPFSAVTDLMTVEDKPELGYESMSVAPIGVDASGNTILSVDFTVGNRGSKTAEDVFVQFSYESGTDSKGEPVYSPLNITNNTLTVGTEAELTTSAVTGDNLQNGILYLQGTDGNDIRAGYGRTVTGNINVSPGLYQGALTGSLNLKIEVYSKADDTTSWTAGLVEAEHGEYNTADNSRVVQIENRTFFTVASKVTIPMGNTMRLPVSVTTTTGDTAPVILVDEFPAQGESSHLGVMNYQAGTYKNGTDSGGTLVLAPSSTGSGFIRLMDTNTNSFFDVAYTVTEAAEGINIFNDNEMFAFKNADGKDYDAGGLLANQNWVFATAVNEWGADKTAPYLNNISRGEVGASFTFTTQAQSIELVFNGEVKVESTFPGFKTKTVSASGGDGKESGEYATVYFGKNETNYTHTVTITVTGGGGSGKYADFDRLVEKYGSSGTPKPAEDEASPHIYWSRSFPDTASLTTDKNVSLSAYVFDDGTLANVTINGRTPDSVTKHSDGFWEIKLTLENSDSGTMKVAAQDTAGNRTTQSVTVDWFNSTVSQDASAAAPALTAQLEKKDGTVLTDSVPFKSGDEAFIDAATDANATTSVTWLNINTDADGLRETPISAGTGEDTRFPVTGNGWYIVTAKNEKGQWTAKVLTMTRIDNNLPAVTLAESAELQSEGSDPVLEWTVRKDTSNSTVKNTIAEVKINGQSQTISTGQTILSGSFTATHGGVYTASATDTAGNEGKSADLTLSNVKIRLASGKTTSDLYTITNARKNSESRKDNGAVELNSDYLKVLVGGTYDKNLTPEELAAGTYRGVYEWELVKLGADESPAEGEALKTLLNTTGWTTERNKSGLEPGRYVLYVRDAQEPENTETVAAFTLTVGDESIAVYLKDKVEKDTDTGAFILKWSASKGSGALVKMTDVTINGYSLVKDTFSAEGSFVLTHAGAYALTATDGTSTETKTVTIDPADIPIAVKSGASGIKVDNPLTTTEDSTRALATIHNPWNQANNNGSVDVDVSVLIGGAYDSDLSDEATNTYVGSYEWQLLKLDDFDGEHLLSQLKDEWYRAHPKVRTGEEIPAEELEAIEAEVARQKAKANEGTVVQDWSSGTQVSGLSSGRYRLVVRDANNKENGNVLEVRLVLDDESVKLETASRSASARSASNGQITAKASGGYGMAGTYQFIVRPISDEDQMLEDLSTLTTPLDAAEYPDWSAPQWQPADLSGGVAGTAVFEGLPAGWYQVAVRPMVGATSAKMQELFELYTAYDQACLELTSATAANTESGIAKALSAQKAAVNTALTAWRNAAEEEKDAAWNAYTALVNSDSGVLTALDAWKNAGFRGSDLRTAYETAVEACLSRKVSAEAATRLSTATAEHEAKEKAYTDLRSQLETDTAKAYADNTSLWDNAATMAVYVNYRSPSTKIEVRDLEYPDDETVKVTYSDNRQELSDSAEDQLITDNAERDIIAVSDTMLVVIPKGTLSKDDNVDQMLMPFSSLPEDPDGSVVQWTGSNGETMLVGWSYITTERVSYIASRSGSYQIISNPVSFKDVPETYWGYDEIGFTAAREMFTGVGGGQFDTDGVMTRAMFVTVLGRLADADVGAYSKKTFSDVDPDTWYGPYVAWAADHGIVNGVGDGKFAPDEPVTREQICTVLSRYISESGLRMNESVEAVSFRDADQISSWAAEAVGQFQRSGIVEGTPNGSFLPGDDATRVQCAAIYARLIQAVLSAYGG